MDCDEKELQQLIAAGFQNQNMGIEDLRSILEQVRQYYNLDRVFVSSDRSYKYVLELLVACTRPGLDHQDEPVSLKLTKAQHEALVQAYRVSPICEGAALPMKGYDSWALLRAGLMRNGDYYGLVAFRAAEGHVWTNEERATLAALCPLVFMYLGVSRLNPNGDNTRRVEECFQDENVLSCYYFDMQAGECHSVKLAEHLRPFFGDWCEYAEMLRIYTDRFVDPIYGERLQREFSLEALRERLTERARVVTMQFPRIIGEDTRWLRYAVEALDFNDGVAQSAVVTFEDVTEEAQQGAYLAHESGVGEDSKLLITGVDLDTMRCGVYVDNRGFGQEELSHKFGGSYAETAEYVASVIPAGVYRRRFNEFFSAGQIISSFEKYPEGVVCEFPYELDYATRWFRIEGKRARDYAENNRRIVMYYSDITLQKEHERELREVNESLEQERELSARQQRQLFYDPLTGALNRTGFEQQTMLAEACAESLGFMMVDVDRFKEINDSFGHEYGDTVLVEVASLLMSTFRSEDRVFRLGGDEFAVMLFGCGDDAWPSIRAKLEFMHGKLAQIARDGSNITLSCGLVVSGQGYSKGLAMHADEALYNTKRNGRAGITQVGQDGKVLNFWHDANARLTVDAKQSEITRWRIENLDGKKKPRLILDYAGHSLLSMPESLTPEECYERWAKRISPRHVDFMHELCDKTTATGTAEGTYCWMHPTQGEILLRSSMKLDVDDSGWSIYGYTVPFKETSVIYNHDDGQFLMQAMNSIFYCSYYIDIRSRDFYITKGHEDEPDVDQLHTNIDEVIASFVDAYVHPDYRDLVREFTDLETLEERFKDELFLDCEYLSLMKCGWARSRFLPVKWDAAGRLTHVLLSSGSIDKVKSRELQRERDLTEAMKLRIRIAEIISKTTVFQAALVSKETGDTKLWGHAVGGDDGATYTFAHTKAWALERVCEQDAARFTAEYDLEHILATVEQEGEFILAYKARDLDGEVANFQLHYVEYDDDPSKLILVIENVNGLEG